jgi:hypothetical protein
MSILNNAVMSIQVGLEDLIAGTPARMLSSVRNLHAGVLLLLKSRLLELSPPGSDEVLLKQKIKPRMDGSGHLEFVGSGKKTVEVEEIKQRLTALGVDVEWKRIERLTQERNNIEHYYAQVSDEAMRGLAADVLLIVRDFTARELKRDPRELFGEAAWEQLLKNKEVFDAERAACLNALRAVKWSSAGLAAACEDYPCSECAARLWYPADPSCELDDLVLQCRSCGKSVDADEFVEDALRQHLAFDAQRSVQDGDRDPLATCPECMHHTFVLEEDSCARCGYERAYAECLRCGAELDIEEQEFEGVCGYCDHVASKDD